MKTIRKIAEDPRVLRVMRNLCPRCGSGCDSITITVGGRSVELTPETRKKIATRLRKVR